MTEQTFWINVFHVIKLTLCCASQDIDKIVLYCKVYSVNPKTIGMGMISKIMM